MDSLASQIQEQMPGVALSAKGVITYVNGASSVLGLSVWPVPFEQRWVDVACTSTHGAVPRYYRSVGWNSAPGHFALPLFAPKVGDGVLLGFMNGSSEFPYVIAHYPGKATGAASVLATTPRTQTLSKTVQAAHAGMHPKSLLEILTAAGITAIENSPDPALAYDPSLYIPL